MRIVGGPTYDNTPLKDVQIMLGFFLTLIG